MEVSARLILSFAVLLTLAAVGAARADTPSANLLKNPSSDSARTLTVVPVGTLDVEVANLKGGQLFGVIGSAVDSATSSNEKMTASEYLQKFLMIPSNDPRLTFSRKVSQAALSCFSEVEIADEIVRPDADFKAWKESREVLDAQYLKTQPTTKYVLEVFIQKVMVNSLLTGDSVQVVPQAQLYLVSDGRGVKRFGGGGTPEKIGKLDLSDGPNEVLGPLDNSLSNAATAMGKNICKSAL